MTPVTLRNPRRQLHGCVAELCEIPWDPAVFEIQKDEKILPLIRRMVAIWTDCEDESEWTNLVTIDPPKEIDLVLPGHALLAAAQICVLMEARSELAELFVQNVGHIHICCKVSDVLLSIRNRTMTVFKAPLNFADSEVVNKAIVPEFGQLMLDQSSEGVMSEYESYIAHGRDRVSTIRREFMHVVLEYEGQIKPLESSPVFSDRERIRLTQHYVSRLRSEYEEWLGARR